MPDARGSAPGRSPQVQDGRTTVEAWHRLMHEAFVRLWWSDDEAMTVEFDVDAAADVRQRLLELVAAQRGCGDVLHWQVRREGRRLRLRVTGEGAADTVAALMY